ncbi:hypothetical protein ACFE04_027422 [Oxalis oulophora]
MSELKGYRFKPTESELVNYYLKMMVLGYHSDIEFNVEVDILKHEPWDLPGFAAIQSEDQYWYFFYKLGRLRNSNRAARKTNSGYWKITGQDRPVYGEESEEEIGTKKTLTFYNGRFPDGVKTNWTKQDQFHATAADFPANQEGYVVCCLRRKHGNDNNSSPNEGESSRPHHAYPDHNATTEDSNPLSMQNLVNSGWASPMDFQNQNQIGYYNMQQQPYNNNGMGYYNMQHQPYNNNGMGYYNDYSNQGDQQFFDSLIVDPEENSHIYRNRSSPPKSLQMISLDSSNTTGIKTFPLQYGEVLQPSHDSLVHSSADKPYKINGRNSPTQKSENKRIYRNFLANADDHKQNTITGSTKDTKKYPKIQTKVPKRSVSDRTA